MTLFTRLNRPVAVFDAGIGSYAAVAALRRMLPEQDILYLADRASFPYGAKSRPDLLATMRRTLAYLDRFRPAAVLMASNAPSVTVLDALAGMTAAPVFGVRPPVARAVALAGDGEVALMGVASMIDSPQLAAHVAREAGRNAGRVRLVNASPLVELVESGAFLFDPGATQAAVTAFLDDLGRRHPRIVTATLSSTHLPWLEPFLRRARPDWTLLDRIEDAVAAIAPHAVAGTGRVLGLVTEGPGHTAAGFRAMLSRLGVSLPLEVVALDAGHEEP